MANVLESNYGKMSYRWFHNDAYRSPVVSLRALRADIIALSTILFTLCKLKAYTELQLRQNLYEQM